MACTFTVQNGKIIDVRNEDGSPSKLFEAALNKFGDREQAIDLVAITRTEDFQELYGEEEQSLQTVIDYVARENANKKELSLEQAQDLKNSILSLENITSLEAFQIGLQQAFYPQGNIFAPTQSSLTNSGLYSPYEVQTILSDIDLQQRIKSAVEALNNNSEAEIEDYLETASEYKTNEFNSFGKLAAQNPYEVKAEIVQALGGISSQIEFNEAVSALELPVPTEGLYEEMQQYVRAQELSDVDGQIIPATLVEDKRQEILLGMSADVNPQTLSNIATILNTPDAVLDANTENLTVLLSSIENNLIGQGLDVVGLQDLGVDKPFLQSLQSFLVNPSVENTNTFLNEYARMFNITGAQKTVVLKESNKNRTYIYLETKAPEDVLLVEQNLIKTGDNTYIKVRRQPLDSLYSIVESYPEKYPQGENLQQYVQRRSAEIENIEDRDLAEELALLKIYFDTPMNITPTVDITEQAFKEEIYQPISEDFLVDFQKERLAHKQKNSPQWNNFYRFFKIDSRGLTLTNNDSITLNKINSWIEGIKTNIAKGLRQFSVISTQLPNLNSLEESIIDNNTMRSVAINYPSAIQKLATESFRVDENTLIAKNATERFSKLDNNNLFEAVETKGNLTLYVKLPQNNTYYNVYKVKQPTTTKQLQDYTYLETTADKWVTPKNTLSKEQREEIKQQNFNC